MLSDARSEVRDSDSSKSDSPSKKESCSDDDYWDDDCDDDVTVSGNGAWILDGLTIPWWVPAAAVGDDYVFKSYFPPAPYEHDLDGFMMLETKMPVDGLHSLWRARFEYAEDFDDLSRFGGHILWEHVSRFGIDSSFGLLREEPNVGPNDSLWMGDFNVVFRFAQSKRVSMRSGIGVNWMSDEVGSDFGFNFTYGGDFFPADPWVVSAEIDWGTLGDASLFHGRATVGLQLDCVTLYTGYDYLNIDGVEIDGIVAGAEFWF